MDKTAIIYQRVSTDEQKEKGYSIQAQTEKLEKYCRDNNIRIVGSYQEDFSAKDGFERPEYRKITEFIRTAKEKPTYVLVTQWSRFSRNIQYSLNEIDRLEKLGVQANAIEQWIDGSIPENLFLLVVYLTTPEIENRRHSLRTIDGMRKALKMGHWMHKAPYGYIMKRNEEGKPTLIHGPDAPIVKKAFELVATGQYHRDEVRNILKKDGIKIAKQMFYYLLEKEVYCGYIHVPAYKNEPAERVKGKIDPIISEELYNSVQRVIKSNRRVTKRPEKAHAHLPLRGQLVCVNCGKMVSGYTTGGNGGKYHYYDCKYCNKNRFRPEQVNAAIIKMLAEISFPEEVGTTFMAMLKSALTEKNTDSKGKAERLRLQLTDVKERSMKLEEGFHILGSIPKPTYDILSVKYREEIDLLEESIKEAQTDFTYLLPRVKKGLHYLNHLDEAWVNGTVRFQSNLGKAIFPENLSFENGQLRTKKVNSFICLMAHHAWGSEEYPKKMETVFGLHSIVAPPLGLEPRTP